MVEMIADEDVQYALDLVKTICTEVGPGLPATPQERERATRIKNELEAHLGAENVSTEEFTVAPAGFLGSYPLGALLLLIAGLLNRCAGWVAGSSSNGIAWGASFFANITALTFAILALWILIREYMQYAELIDPYFPQKQSVNVIGRLHKPRTQAVKRLLILSGHHDSALENTWFSLLGYGAFASLPTILIGYLTMIVMSLLQLAGLISGSAAALRAGTLGWGLLIFPILPAILFSLFFNRGRKNGGNVPGAADNLSACAVVVTACRFLAKHPECIPDNTEIRFITFGCEEAGLRGSRRYAARHLQELKRLDARLLNYETIAYPSISITTTDVNGVKNDPEMVKSLDLAADRTGVPHQVSGYPFGGGGSDAGPFSQAGLKAATLFPCKFPQQIVEFYHQKRDTPDILTRDPLLNVLKLTIAWVRNGGE